MKKILFDESRLIAYKRGNVGYKNTTVLEVSDAR